MVLEYRVGWNVGGANPGVTVLHGRPTVSGADQDAAEDLAAKARVLFDGLKALFPPSMTFSFPGECVELNTTTGVLEDVYVFTPPANVVATGTGNWTAPAGGRIEWRTEAIVAGRRLRGRTFFVPFTIGSYDGTGTLASATITLLQTEGLEYMDAGLLVAVRPCIWSRTHGILADITSLAIPDEVSVLRSRRD